MTCAVRVVAVSSCPLPPTKYNGPWQATSADPDHAAIKYGKGLMNVMLRITGSAEAEMQRSNMQSCIFVMGTSTICRVAAPGTLLGLYLPFHPVSARQLRHVRPEGETDAIRAIQLMSSAAASEGTIGSLIDVFARDPASARCPSLDAVVSCGTSWLNFMLQRRCMPLKPTSIPAPCHVL